jgi:hypothetical protein
MRLTYFDPLGERNRAALAKNLSVLFVLGLGSSASMKTGGMLPLRRPPVPAAFLAQTT